MSHAQDIADSSSEAYSQAGVMTVQSRHTTRRWCSFLKHSRPISCNSCTDELHSAEPAWSSQCCILCSCSGLCPCSRAMHKRSNGHEHTCHGILHGRTKGVHATVDRLRQMLCTHDTKLNAIGTACLIRTTKLMLQSSWQEPDSNEQLHMHSVKTLLLPASGQSIFLEDSGKCHHTRHACSTDFSCLCAPYASTAAIAAR